MFHRALGTRVPPAPPTTRRRLVRSSLMAAVLAALPFSQVVANAQSDSPAGANVEVIAQGVSALPAGQIAWRLVEDTAEPVGGAAFEERALGFAVATQEALLLTDEADGSRARLAPGEAAFTLDGITQMRESLGDGASPYLRIALVGADEASNPNGDTLIHAGESFESPADDRDLDLVSVRLDAGETASVPSEFPVLVVVLAGQASIDDQELAAGDAATLGGSVELEAGKDGTHVLVAAIGASVSGSRSGGAVSTPAADAQITPSVDTPTSGVGRLIVLSKLCPPGVGPDQAADPSAAACFGGGPVDNLPITITALSDNATWTVYPSGGTASVPDLAPGSYLVSFGSPDGLGTTVGVCGGQDGSADLPVIQIVDGQVQLDIAADREYLCDTSTTQLYDQANGDPVETGSIAAVFHLCPDGMTVDTVDPAQCAPVELEPFDFGFQAPGAQSLADASLHGANYVWEGLAFDDIYSPVVLAYPPGYSAYGISNNGGPIIAPHAGGVIPTADQPNIYLDVYFFTA